MMETTFEVQIWSTYVYAGKRTTTYWVRWIVAGRKLKRPFKREALADSFRSDLTAAARKGEAFLVDTGLPVSMRRAEQSMTWYQFACKYVDLHWERDAGTTRRTNAEALARATWALLASQKGMPAPELLRHALNRWAFNTIKRDSPDCPADVKAALKWVSTHTVQMAALGRPDIARKVLDTLARRLDGGPSAASVFSRHKKIFNAVLNYAVEEKAILVNPVPDLKWTMAKTTQIVDKRRVVNPDQARGLLQAVARTGRAGKSMVAFYACLYYAALRPEEAVGLRKDHLSLPREGWGELHVEVAEPHAGKDWTDSGKNRDRRRLKQRDVGVVRPVPCPPELTRLLWEHMDRFGLGPDGRLFVGERNKGELPKGTINRVWRIARRAAFTPEAARTPLGETPYDLRHAAVSTWLNAGVPAADVAEWAGQSIEILLRIYAKCLDGGAAVHRKRIEEALASKAL